MRVKNTSKVRIDHLGPGEEGDLTDNRATRLLIADKSLEPLEALPPEPPARRKGVVIVERGDREGRHGPSLEEALAEIERRGARIAELEDLLRERDARIAGLEEELGALTSKNPKSRHKE